MELPEKVYYGNKKLLTIYVFLSFIPFIILFYYHPDIIRALHLPPVYNSVFSLMIGVIHTGLTYGLFRSFYKPKIRICDHFLITSYDLNVIKWKQITRMRVTTEGWLIINTSEGAKTRTDRVNVGSVSNREEFLDDMEKICEAKGIPFEKPEGPIRFFNL